jgi:hypothetical protein
MTNMVARIGDQRATRVSQSPFLALTSKIDSYNNHAHLLCFSSYKFIHEVPRGLHILQTLSKHCAGKNVFGVLNNFLTRKGIRAKWK